MVNKAVRIKAADTNELYSSACDLEDVFQDFFL